MDLGWIFDLTNCIEILVEWDQHNNYKVYILGDLSFRRYMSGLNMYDPFWDDFIVIFSRPIFNVAF